MTRYNPEQGERIPLARTELAAIAAELRTKGLPGLAGHIEDIVKELMFRNSSGKRKARAKQTPMTSGVVADIQRALKRDPGRHHRDIGRDFGVDGGRVAEIALGQRTVAYPQGTPEWRGM